jgi:hypothetical protein
MASTSNLKVSACILEPENSTPRVFAKDQRSYKFSDLSFAIENPVDFESLRVNGFPKIKDRFERQGMLYYFDAMNGPTYVDAVKEFWMKASVISKDVYVRKVKDIVAKQLELEGKTPKEMGLRPFVTTEIESFVAGIRVSIRLCHIYEALHLSRGGLVLLSTDNVGPDVDSYLFKPITNPKGKLEWTDVNKIIYKIFNDNILCKIGSSDQISDLQKLFRFHVSKGNFVDVAKILFLHLAESITSKKPIIRHGRMLSHMFAQSGLMDAIKPFFPGYGNFLTKFGSTIDQELDDDEPQESPPNQDKPPTPPPEHQSSPQEHRSPSPEHQQPLITELSPSPSEHVIPNSDDVVVVNPLSTTVNDSDKSPQHVDKYNTSTLATPIKERFHQLYQELDSEVTTPPKNLQAFMQRLFDNCIVARLDLPSRISNEPLDVSQEDITKYLCDVDKNMRRMTTAISERSIDDAHIETEFEVMESTFLDMMKAAKQAYKMDLAFRIEIARKVEGERLRKEAEELERKKIEEERLRKEAEELERKRLEEERIEKERLEAQAREEARLAEEARIAAEQAKFEELTRNALEFALIMRQRQENMEINIDRHETLLNSIFQMLNERLPPPPPQPQP